MVLVAVFLRVLLAPVSGQEVVRKEALGRVHAGLGVGSIRGGQVQPFRCDDGQRASVVVFITTDCPIANRYAPELERLRTDFKDKGVKLTLAHVDTELSDERAREHAAQFALKAAVVVDRKHLLVRATGATMTPEAVVVDVEGCIRYRGRIDDWFTAFGKSRRRPSQHDLRDAIQAVLEGRSVRNPETRAVGCLMPKLR